MLYKDTDSKKQWRTYNPIAAWSSYVIRDAKIRALKKGLPFDIDRNYVLTIMTDTCPIFGTAFNYGQNRGIQPSSPSLDRIIPKLGYTKGNVVLISAKANGIKSAYTSKEIYMVADWLHAIEKGKE